MVNGASAASGGGTNRLVLTVAATVALLGGLLSAYATGIMSGALLFVGEDLGLSDAAQQTVVGSSLFGAVLVVGPLTDRTGRRTSIIAAAVVFALVAAPRAARQEIVASVRATPDIREGSREPETGRN